MGVGVHQVEQQTDQNIVDLVFEDLFSWTKLRQVSHQVDGSTADLIVVLDKDSKTQEDEAPQRITHCILERQVCKHQSTQRICGQKYTDL